MNISRRKFFGMAGSVAVATALPVYAATESEHVEKSKRFKIVKINLARMKKEYNNLGITIMSLQEGRNVSFIKEEAAVASIMLSNSVTKDRIITAIQDLYSVDTIRATAIVESVTTKLEAQKMLITYEAENETARLKAIRF